MAYALKLTGLLLALSATIAVGAPEDGAPLEKKVFPLVKEGDMWWVGVADMCEIVGARFEGEGFSYKLERGNVLRMEVLGKFGGNGPFKITLGEDTYEFKLGEFAITRNGDEFGDFLMQPKRIDGVVSATLEDLARVLVLAVGDDVDGQPTISSEAKQYRLVQGERKWQTPVLRDGDAIVVGPDDLRKRMEEAPFIWRDWPGMQGGAMARPGQGEAYTEHNGMTYRRGTAGLQMGPYAPVPASRGTETLYGPVVPNRFHAEGASADLMYLSIVQRRVNVGGVATRGRVEDQRDQLSQRK